MTEQEAQQLADDVRKADDKAEVQGTILITQAEPAESVEMHKDHAVAVLTAHDALPTKLSLQQFYDIVQGVWKQHPNVTPKAIASFIVVVAEETHTTAPQELIGHINTFIDGANEW